MRVTFVLPGAAPVPTGGARVILQYANALAAAGSDVAVVMPAGLRPGSVWLRLARYGRFHFWSQTQGWSPRQWMAIHPRVQLYWVPDLAARHAPPAEAVVASAVLTAEAVARWPASAGRKFYLVQGYETWDFSAERVEASWRLPLRKLAVSRWLCGLVAGAGASADYLPNGLDPEAFGLDRPIGEREPATVIWPYHVRREKGAADAESALAAIRRDIPQIRVTAFGVDRPPAGGWSLPLSYHRNPPQMELRRLYNNAAIAVAPSHSEGWGLPACEALQCGCALAATDIGGHREFLRDGENALLHAPGDIDALRRNLLRLAADRQLRLRLAAQGVTDMAQLGLAPAARRFLEILRE
jgi:glycosyltransferase involved in cell wall biosynthesis